MTYKSRAALAVSLSLAVILAPPFLRADVIEQILVKVNGEIFTKTDLENRQIAVLRQRGGAVDLRGDIGNQQLRKLLDEVTPRIMVEVVDEILVVQRGKELGYQLTDEQFTSILESIKKENKLESEEQFQAALKSDNLTLADLRRNLERQMIIQRVQQNEVMGKVSVSDEEARAYYQSHVSEFTTTPAVTLREILVAVPSDPKGVNVAEDAAAKGKVDQIAGRLVAGERFEELAAAVSDAPSRANAGLIGPISLNELSAELRKIIEGMKVGDVSQVLRTQRGYQLLKLESSTSTETTSFEQARQQISDRVFVAKREEQLEKYLTKLRAEAIIEWKNQDVKKAYDEGRKQKASGA